ncbi:hypothetical protein, conserved [Trypanosoma brucei gambiense DAL972]|uniref:Haloacid dehalogenase-like hydrolase n=2 Tax=Trypanosoma brucei TaxID=5691 RepID=D0AAC8_TRYB9|nr:hypothetical protein, conserved [Trypanosoma brucei gambiense DAL972]RHW68170.1 Haloacid dehalogenase-like hydrolase [Trypanosoma brucei equiperdum]CBH18629.1 hypothetical protein, conserved [Trypanosoma brucei gambiense DAL972]|eukprot:XP_011780893.1 hypothetical protein, conserved [Trypanosoma brucei gambiense DAL972]
MGDRVGVSFDLVGTLLAVRRSAGYQYGCDLLRFLARKGLQFPAMDERDLEASFKRSMKSEISKSRKVWMENGLGDGEEMPLGGVAPEEVLSFWYRVVDGTFDREGNFCHQDEAMMSAVEEVRQGEDWREFIENTLRRFSTAEPYCWLPEALPTLRALKQWRENDVPPGVYCDPPTLVSNTDSRLVAVIGEMLKDQGETDLLGELFFADAVGAAKPSPQGIIASCKKCGVTSMRHWIHIGDEDEDRVAAARAGCNFLLCSPTKGPVWSELLAKLQEICDSAQSAGQRP